MEGTYFKNALSDFTYEMASGDAIRRLADLGYTVAAIMRKLDFPTPAGRVQKTVWQHFMDTGMLTDKEPVPYGTVRKESYAVELDGYGRKTFRKVYDDGGNSLLRGREQGRGGYDDGNSPARGGEQAKDGDGGWNAHVFSPREDGEAGKYLAGLCAKYGSESSYAGCDFGLVRALNPKRFSGMLKALQDIDDRDYVDGLFLEARPVWHRLTPRMVRIVAALYAGGEYKGDCYFTRVALKVRFGA